MKGDDSWFAAFVVMFGLYCIVGLLIENADAVARMLGH